MVTTWDNTLGTQKGHSYADFSERDVDVRMHLLQSDIAPITTVLMNLTRGKKANQVKVEWPERQLLPHTTKSNGGNTSADLVVLVDNPEYCKVGDHLLDQLTGELMGPIISKNTGAGTVTLASGGRGLIGTVATTIADNDPLIIQRGNILEGGYASDALATLPTMVYNYIEATSTTYKNTDLLELSMTYANVHTWKDLRALKMKDHMEDLEKKVLYGIRGLDTSGSQAKYFMGGLINQYIIDTVETVNVGAGGTKTFTKKQWETFIRRLFNYNQSSRRKTVYCSAEVIETISDFKYQALNLTPNDVMFNTAVFSYRSNFGIVDIVHHRFLNEDFGTDWYALGLDLKNIEWLNFQPQQIRENIQERRSHSREDEIYQVNSMKVFNGPVHGIFRVTATA
ncbi:MAG: SU10 major capsid protein [Thermodesulfobacteriota bacterium]